MQNGTSKDTAEQPSPGISADFLTGSTDIGLDRIRTRLLDLTNRNKLLNFKHPNASSLRVVDVPIDPVYGRLRENEKLIFSPVPDPGVHRIDVVTAKDYADELGWNTSFDLSTEEKDDVQSLPVLHYQEPLDTVSRKITAAAKTAIEESGMNMLYLVFGFLEWYESDDSKQPHHAPLVIVPVTIDRTAGKGRVIETVLEYSGEDIETNLSLVEMMRRDFGLEVPLLEDDDTPERYFDRFADILKLKKRWTIRRQITLALLSFGKLLMYRDLDPKNWPKDQSIAKHPLVRELFEGSKKTEVALADEYPIDAPELQKDVPHLIRDADSSQHSALIHALRGQSLVIEGPPGTGKSQTITNLIAAALARGKTVLFVSEKLAALEVVRKRLDDAGLGIFCLEIHSHKTKKGALIADLAQRNKARRTFRDPIDLDRQLSLVDEKKRQLTQYAALINKNIEPFNATVFDILWARDRCGQEIARHRDGLGQIALPGITTYTRKKFTQAEQFLSVYVQHLVAVIAPWNILEQHPWVWIARPLSFEEEEQAVRLLEEFRDTVRQAEECCDRLQETAGLKLTRTAYGLEQAADMLGRLPDSEISLASRILAPCQSAATRAKLAAFVAQVESFRRTSDNLSHYTGDVSSLLTPGMAEKLAGTLEILRLRGLEDHSVADIRQLLDLGTEAVKQLGQAHSSFRALLDVLGCEAPATLSSAAFLMETLKIVESAPFDRLHLRRPSFEYEHTKPALQAARHEAESLKEAEMSLRRDFDLSLGGGAYSPSQLLECAAALDEATIVQQLFGKAYRHAAKVYRRIALAKKKAARRDMSRALRALAGYAERRAQFDSHATYQELLGTQFQGVHSAWDDFEKVLLWYEQIFIALPEHQPQAEPYRRLMFTARVERLRAIKASTDSAPEHPETLRLTVARAADFTRSVPSQRALMASGSFEDVLACLQLLNRELGEALQVIDRAAIRDDVALRNVPSILMSARQCIADMTSVGAGAELPALLGEAYRGVDTDILSIRQTLQFVESIVSGSLPATTAEWLLCEDYRSRFEQLRASLSTAASCGTRLNALTQSIAALSGWQRWKSIHNGSWDSLKAVADDALSNPEELPRWNHFLRQQIKSREAGLDKLTALAESRTLEPDELGRAFRFVFYNTLARWIFAEHMDLTQMTGVTQETLQGQFAAADKEAIRLYSERVAALIDRREVPYGNQGGPVRTWTNMALITNEINKQKRHIPIRQLVRRSADALLALKPCFMMGPLSVAQYLAPGQLKFDLVVMDEASQLKPEDAIGALARGGQVVIVGDPKQLPPTSFFQRVPLDEDDKTAEESRTAVEEGESILDVASTLFQPVRRLRWHYRSRHHSLIAFSNEEFYQGDLIIFPSAYHDDPSLGIKHHFIHDGVCENSRNPREAAVVVNAVLEHMREHPDESLGIVTMNFEQRELLEELLDRQLRSDPAAIAFQERMRGGQETLFIKNLENVQGDERDVIFISTTYGPDARGNPYQRFGPINGENGHRRLNVLFTRSKKRTVVFSSLDPDLIKTGASSSLGLKALKKYLIYARTGILQQSDGGGDQPTNDFERSVGAVLKENGYDVVPQVGVAGFFIDLGVRHPAKGGAFLLGIECDGASYHSGRSARDRDRLRQEILENLGWKIHRIWSTDWFKSRDSEIKRLLKRTAELLEHDPAYRKQQEKANKGQQLRRRLVALRDSEIKADFPDTPLEKGLLNPSLLEVFVEKRPKTRDDWFQRIPQQFRTNVDSKQVGKYLDRVLELIADSDG